MSTFTSRLRSSRIAVGVLLAPLALAASPALLGSGAADARMPSTGGVYLGAAGDEHAVRNRTSEQLAAHEYGYFEQRPEEGRMLTVRFQNFKSWSATANLAPGSTGYQQIVSWADALKKRSGDVLVAFHHEPETTGAKKFGTAAQFKAAFRKVVTIFRNRGADNVSFTWQMTAYAFRADSGAYNAAAKWYPGDKYVDVVAVDPYNWYNCGHGKGRWQSLQTLSEPALDFAKKHGKQLALAEFASVRNAKRPAWIKEGGQWLAANDKHIVAAFYFNRKPTNQANAECTWPLSSDADFAAFRDLARMPVFKH